MGSYVPCILQAGERDKQHREITISSLVVQICEQAQECFIWLLSLKVQKDGMDSLRTVFGLAEMQLILPRASI